MFRVDQNTNNSRPVTPPPPGHGTASKQAGQLPAGASAMPPGQLSSLADAAEELSLHLADKTEKKVHAERKVKADRHIEPMPAPAVLELMRHAKDPLAQNKLEALIRTLASGQHSASSLRQELARSFGDISHQFLAAHFVLGQILQDGTAPDLVAALQEVITEFEAQHGDQIWAGINSAPVLGPVAADAEEAQTLTEAYREFALEPRPMGETLKLSLKTFGGRNAETSLAHMSRALSNDLNAPRPSTSPHLLASVSASLYQIRSAITALHSCNDLADGWRQQGHSEADGERLMLDLAALTDKKHTSPRDISPLPETHGMGQLQARFAFLSGILGVVADLPVSIFADSNARSSCTDAIRAVITESAEREDQQ